MLTGILVPTSGTLIVDGLVPHMKRQQNARNIGVVFGQRTTLWWDIPVVESFNLARDIYDIPAKQFKQNLGEFSELLGLNEFMNIPAGKVSLGQRMRADLCMALLHDPKLLYLDEPTIGLDIAVKDSIRKFVRRQVDERGVTVMLTTHDLGDIEDICNRIVIIDSGKIIHDGDLKALKDNYARDRVIHFQLACWLPFTSICEWLPKRTTTTASPSSRAPSTSSSSRPSSSAPATAREWRAPFNASLRKSSSSITARSIWRSSDSKTRTHPGQMGHQRKQPQGSLLLAHGQRPRTAS